MTREEILKAAQSCISGEREEDYGSPEDNFRMIAALWTSYLRQNCAYLSADICILPSDVAAMMALLKIARIATGSGHADSWIDLAGYAACGGEIATGG